MKKKKMKKITAGGTLETHTYANKQYLVEYLNVSFR